jgi:hypothetical protein
MATPMYDALVREYRQALRCVPGEQGTDPLPRLADDDDTPLPQTVSVLPSAARRAAVPHQLSRHRGTSGDSPSSPRF